MLVSSLIFLLVIHRNELSTNDSVLGNFDHLSLDELLLESCFGTENKTFVHLVFILFGAFLVF